MGQATNSSRGRAMRSQKSSRRRGTTLYDRLEEARSRRQVVLANKKVAGASLAAVEPAISRSKTSTVESTGTSLTAEENDPSAAKSSFCSSVASESDAVALEFASGDELADSLGPSWRLIASGIFLGFFVAIGVIGWISLTSGPTATVAEANTLAPSLEAAGAPTANLGPNMADGEGPQITHETTAQISFASHTDDYTPPNITNRVPVVAGGTPPAQIVPATVELPPLLDVMPPARQLGPPFVLKKIPPIRPEKSDPPAIVAPVYPGIDIVLHVPNGVRQSDAQRLITAATEAGFEISKARPAGFSISQTNIRYFHERDAGAAQALANAVGGRLRDFTDFRPPPDTGVIEVWLKGRGTSARRQQNSAARGGVLRDLQNLRAGLRRVFRRGGG